VGQGEESSASLTLLSTLRLRWIRQVCLATWIQEREMASSTAFNPSATTRVRLTSIASPGGPSSSRRPPPWSGPQHGPHTVVSESQSDQEHPLPSSPQLHVLPVHDHVLEVPPHLQLLGLELGVPNTGRRRALSTSPSSLSNSSSTLVLTLSPVQHGQPHRDPLQPVHYPRRETLNPFKNLYLA